MFDHHAIVIVGAIAGAYAMNSDWKDKVHRQRARIDADSCSFATDRASGAPVLPAIRYAGVSNDRAQPIPADRDHTLAHWPPTSRIIAMVSPRGCGSTSHS
jgi:hypothetical protein